MKFLSGLPPLKIPSRADNEAIRKALEGNWEPEDSPLSDFIDRPPPLPWNIEHDLRKACAAIVEDTGNAEKESTGNEWFNFSNPSKSRNQSRPRTGKKSEIRDESRKREPEETSEESDKATDAGTEDLAETKQDVETDIGLEAVPLPVVVKRQEKDRLAVNHIVKLDQRRSFSYIQQNKPSSQRENPFRKTIHLEPLNTAIAVPLRRPRTAPTSHSSNTSDSAIASASTDGHPLSASTGITSVTLSPATKSYATGLRPKSTIIPTRVSQESQAAHEYQKSSLEQTKDLYHPPQTAIEASIPVKPLKEGFTASIKKFVRNRSRSISKSRDETPLAEKRSSFGGALRNLSLRRNKSMGNLSLRSRSQPNLDSSKVDEDAPPVPKLDPVVKKAEYSVPVHIASLARPQQTTVAPVTSVSLQPARANIVEVQGRSPKTSLSKLESPLNPPEAFRKHSLASSSIDSCFTPPVPQTPDKHHLQNQVQQTVQVREISGAGHVDILKAARSLESLRAQQQLQQQLQAAPGESPVSQLPRSTLNLPPPRKLPPAGGPSHPSSRPTSRGTMRSVASAHSSRSPSRASRAISMSSQHMPLPPLTAKYSIMPNTTSHQHSRSPSQPSGLRHPVYAQSHASAISSANSSVVYLPSTVGRPGTSGGESPLASRTFPPSSLSKLDLPGSTAVARPASSINSRRQTVISINTSGLTGGGLERVPSTTSLATSTTGTVNFSRKFAGNEESIKRESVLANMDVTALPPVPVSVTKGGRLRRVLSSFSVRRSKKF